MSHRSATTNRHVFKRFLKISIWSTYFVYIRIPKTRGFPEVFQRFLILGFWSTFFVNFQCKRRSTSVRTEQHAYGTSGSPLRGFIRTHPLCYLTLDFKTGIINPTLFYTSHFGEDVNGVSSKWSHTELCICVTVVSLDP